MTTIFGEPPRKHNSLNQEELLREYGDIRDVRVAFGLRETFTYHLWSTGKIEGVLVPAPMGGKRGKRLFSFGSIRKFLAECEASGPKKAPYYPRREKKTTSRPSMEQEVIREHRSDSDLEGDAPK
jgi:hypothetical protein